MNTQSLGRLARKLEPGIVVLLFLYYLNPQLPPLVDRALKYGGYGLVALLVIGVGMGRWQRFAYVATRDLFPWLLLGLAMASVLWSAAPEYTSDQIDPVIRASIFGAYLAMRYTPKELMRLVAWTLGIAAVLSLVYALAVPSLGIGGDGLWKGIFGHKQYLGRWMIVGTITFLNIAFDNRRDRLVGLTGFAMAVALVLLSRSTTALIVLLLSLSLFPLFNFVRQQYKLRLVLFITSFLLLSSVAVLIVSNLETIVVDILGKNLEFNGRTPIWTLAIEKGLERPWLGYGYVGFWNSDASSIIFLLTWANSEGKTFHAHNGFIDVFLQLGFVGLSLCLLSFLMLIARTVYLINSTKGRELFWIFQFLIISFVTNVTEGGTFVGSGTMWILYVSISFSTAVWRKRIRGKCMPG